MKAQRIAWLLAGSLVLAACGQQETPVLPAEDNIKPLSSVSSANASLGGSETTPVSVDGCANGDASNLSITFTITGRQGGTATFKVDRNYVFNSSGWVGSNPETVTVGPRAQGAGSETKTVNISLKTGASNASGASTVTVRPYDLTNTATPNLSLDSSATVHVAFASCAPAHTHAAPSISIPADVTLEATSADGAVHTFSVPAQDEDGNALTATCDYASGSRFPVGTTTVNCTVSDNHSSALTASGSFTVTVEDTTKPILNLPSNITTVAPSNSEATVTYTASAADLVDGVVPVNCIPASSSRFPVGTTTVNCSATDAADNTASGSFTVSVAYNFGGWQNPLNALPTRNVVKAGRSIPVKFSLAGNQGLDIFAPVSIGSTVKAPVSANQTCGTTDTDVVEETLTAGASSLSYDAVTGQYTYVWKSDTAWAGKCRSFKLNLKDGSSYETSFQFTK